MHFVLPACMILPRTNNAVTAQSLRDFDRDTTDDCAVVDSIECGRLRLAVKGPTGPGHQELVPYLPPGELT